MMPVRAPEFWAHRGLASTMLQPAAALWNAASRMRRAAARPQRAAVPVLCVGNLVAGGAGKTPVAASLAALLAAEGRRPHLLTRGYGGSLAGPLAVDPAVHDAAAVGDEALLLARAAPCWVARDRAAGARAAVAAGADLLVLDDGFQNPALVQDLALIVVDGGYGLGNGRLIPAGPLRESLASGLARAAAVVLLGEDAHRIAPAIAGRLPILEARLVPIAYGDLVGRKVLAFAGIGRPAKFYETLEEVKARIAVRRDFADHHPYREAELRQLLAQAREIGALPVTTEKDWVRLPEPIRNEVRALAVEVAWQEPEALTELLRRSLAFPGS
jgi:tetraacyldisaccharide 4'-kinase